MRHRSDAHAATAGQSGRAAGGLGYPALRAIFSRRSRRFALGAELTGPLAYRSQAEPVPLAEAEEAILVAAGTGVTGVARDDWPFTDERGGRTGADKLVSFTGRSFPSPLGTHGTELFWTNDEGVFVLPQRDVVPERYLQLRRQRRAPCALPPAPPSWRTSGSTCHPHAEPVRDQPLDRQRRPARRCSSRSPTSRASASSRCCSISTSRIATTSTTRVSAAIRCARSCATAGSTTRHPVDLWDFERWQMVDMNGVEQGLVIQNLMLATQAIGLGGHPFSGGKGRVTMGGEELWHAVRRGGERRQPRLCSSTRVPGRRAAAPPAS